MVSTRVNYPIGILFPLVFLILTAIEVVHAKKSAPTTIAYLNGISGSTDTITTTITTAPLAPPASPAKPLFRESHLAHFLLDNLRGVEIGASIANPFGLNTRNVDLPVAQAEFRAGQQRASGGNFAKVDVSSRADQLPFAESSEDFVVSSHVIEHFYDPIATIAEWLRVVRPGGYVYIIAPHKERNPHDRGRPSSRVGELLARHKRGAPAGQSGGDVVAHSTAWTLEAFVRLCLYHDWQVVALQDADDKVGNGITVVLRK